MSTSNESMIDLANTIMNHPALEATRERVARRLFDKFRTSNPEERDLINTIMDNEHLFFNEIASIASAAKPDDPKDKEIEPIKR